MPIDRCRSGGEPGTLWEVFRTRAGLFTSGRHAVGCISAGGNAVCEGPKTTGAGSATATAERAKSGLKNSGSATAKAPASDSAKAKSTSAAAAQRVALTTGLTSTRSTLKPDPSTLAKAPVPAAGIAEASPPARALRLISACQSRFETVTDYTCTFYKRERVNGRLTPLYVMEMKARTKPKSIYFRFADPYKGREAIFVEGQNGGKILAHEVGFTKFLAGTLELEPGSARAMEDNRHPITEAGIGPLINTVASRWAMELSSDESVLVFDPNMTIGPRHCQLIEAIHTRRSPDFQFHKVRLFIDSELNLPIRFEGYDWPKDGDGPPELAEEYTYADLKINVGLGDLDFDICNRQYSFGHF